MAKPFYLKLAGGNLVRNKKMYGPYCVAVSLMSGMFFIIVNLILSKSVRNLSYGEVVMGMFVFGIVVMTLFTVGYTFYLNSFLIKRRKKEFGLYGVLGMERRHVARVILWESLILGIGSLLLGLVFGLVFGRLAFMLLMNMLDTARGSVFTISGPAIGLTVLVFAAIFVLTTLYNLNQVRLANPVDLLKGEQKGEKKVRLPALLTVVGFAALGYAYYLAVSIKTPALALMWFWPAVILVILATWLLFTGGSVFILGRLRKNKRIYYRPGNFIAISGLIHRMKQNAAGLANICILSTMVMVTVACCTSLYIGQERIVSEQNPSDIRLEIRIEDKARESALLDEAEARAQRLAEVHGAQIERITRMRYTERYVIFSDSALIYADENGRLDYTADSAMDGVRSVGIMLLADYNAQLGESRTLADGEVLLLTQTDVAGLDAFPVADGALRVREVIRDTPFTLGKYSDMGKTLVVVARDMRDAEALAAIMNPAQPHAQFTQQLSIDLDAGQEQGHDIATALRDWFRVGAQAAVEASGSGFYRTENIYENRVDGYGLYGGLLFLGVFFALLFLINTVLIIYFKQISEGFDDCDRFAILQKVGLSDEEVRATVNRQMLIVFMLPLVVSLIHIAAASNMIRQMLGTFMMTDFALTMACIGVTCALFVAVYLVVYRVTARTYYRLVKW